MIQPGTSPSATAIPSSCSIASIAEKIKGTFTVIPPIDGKLAEHFVKEFIPTALEMLRHRQAIREIHAIRTELLSE